MALFVPIFESKFGRLGLLKPGVRIEGTCTAKSHFSQKLILIDFRVDFCGVAEALGAVFLIFVALETGSKFNGFSTGAWGKSHGILGLQIT